MPRNWENEFFLVMGAKGKSFISITKRIAWGATIYHLWRHRNSRIHENDYSSGETIFHLICNDFRLKVQRPTKNTHEVKKDPKKTKKLTAPPLKQRKRGISPKQKYT